MKDVPIYKTTPTVGEPVVWHEKGGKSELPAFVTGWGAAGEIHLFVLTQNPAMPFKVILRCRHKDDPRHTTGETHVDREHARTNGTWSYRPIDLPLKPHVNAVYEEAQKRQAEREAARVKKQQEYEDAQERRREVSHKPEMMSVG